MAIIIEEVPEIRKKVTDQEKARFKDNSLNINGTANFDIAIRHENWSMEIIAAEDVEQAEAPLVEEVRGEVQDLQIADDVGTQEQAGTGDKDLKMLGVENQGHQSGGRGSSKPSC